MAVNPFPPAPDQAPISRASKEDERRLFSDGSIWQVLPPLIEDDDQGVNIVPSYKVKRFGDRLSEVDEASIHAFASDQLDRIAAELPEWTIGQWVELGCILSGWLLIRVRIQCVRQEPRELFIN
jgi:hypothetical protein